MSIYGDALGLVGIEDDCDAAIEHRSWSRLPMWCERSAAGAVDSRLLTKLFQLSGVMPRSIMIVGTSINCKT